MECIDNYNKILTQQISHVSGPSFDAVPKLNTEVSEIFGCVLLAAQLFTRLWIKRSINEC